MPNKPVLSICILSYNQADEIKRLLDSIKPQITPEVEVVIRDDSTNDETEHLINEYSKEMPIRYFHGEKGGIDRTIIFLTEKSKGNFIWWLGDDVIAPGGIKMVLDIIKEYSDLNFIWANSQAESYGLAIDWPEDRLFSDRDEVLQTATTGLGFISSTPIRRDRAIEAIEGSKKYIGSEFVNLYIVLYVLSQPGKYYYLRGPVIINYPATSDEIKERVIKNGQVKNRAFEVFGINFANIVKEFEGPFSSGAVRKTIKKSFGQTWRGVLVAWDGGWDTPKGKRLKMIKNFWRFPESWLALVLFSLPSSLNKAFYRMYRKAFRKTS